MVTSSSEDEGSHKEVIIISSEEDNPGPSAPSSSYGQELCSPQPGPLSQIVQNSVVDRSQITASTSTTSATDKSLEIACNPDMANQKLQEILVTDCQNHKRPQSSPYLGWTFLLL